MKLLLDLLFPNRCLHCNDLIAGEQVICEKCFDQIDFTHWEHLERNPLEKRLDILFPLQNAYALMMFDREDLSRKIIHQIKYYNREKVGKVVADWCADRIMLKTKPDYLVTVPLHPKKQKIRGYNQLHLFANTLSKQWNIPHLPTYLKRITNNRQQAGTSLAEREKSKVQFQVPKAYPQKHILLIDDVCTSGNTLASCVWPMLSAGNKVSVLVMAMDN